MRKAWYIYYYYVIIGDYVLFGDYVMGGDLIQDSRNLLYEKRDELSTEIFMTAKSVNTNDQYKKVSVVLILLWLVMSVTAIDN